MARPKTAETISGSRKFPVYPMPLKILTVAYIENAAMEGKEMSIPPEIRTSITPTAYSPLTVLLRTMSQKLAMVKKVGLIKLMTAQSTAMSTTSIFSLVQCIFACPSPPSVDQRPVQACVGKVVTLKFPGDLAVFHHEKRLQLVRISVLSSEMSKTETPFSAVC